MVLAEDGRFELPQLGARLEPQVVSKQAAKAAVDVERVCLPAGAVEREHQHPPGPLPHRLLRHERLQRPGRFVVTAEGEDCGEALFERDEPLFLEPVALRAHEGLVSQIGECAAPPERERLVEHGQSLGGRRRAPRLGDELLEAGGVDRVVGEIQLQRAPAGLEQAVDAERLAQPRHVDIECVPGRGRRIVRPESVDQRFARHRLVPVQEEVCEERALLPAAQRDRVVLAGLECPDQPELQHGRSDASTAQRRLKAVFEAHA
jgi:hypothetical protein